MRTTAQIAALVAVVAVAAGCGTPPASQQAAPSPQPTAQPTARSTRPQEPTTSPGRRAVLSFVSPSRNIRCEGEPAAHAMACVLRHRTWRPPGGDRRWCHESDLQGIELTQGREPVLLCATDMLVPGPDPVLAYGQVQRAGGFTCWSRRTGVTCTDGGDNRFQLSRETYRLDAISPAHPHHASTFETPDHNITCRSTPSTSGVECAVSTKRWDVPGGDHRWCGQTALQGVGMANGDEPSFLCGTDVLVPGPDMVLAYGQVFHDGPITCWSRRSGVTCTDGSDNHFLVSRTTYRLD